MKIEDRVVLTIKQRKGVAVLRSDVASLGSPVQVDRMLAKLVGSCALVHVSKNMYAETRINRFTGKLSLAAPFGTIAPKTFPRLGRFPSLWPTCPVASRACLETFRV